MESVVSLLLFILIGVLTAAVGELQYSVFIRGDWANLFGSMVFNAVYLAGAFVVSRLLFRLLFKRGLILSNLAARIPEYRDPKRLPRGILDKDQMTKLLQAARLATPTGLKVARANPPNH